MLMKTSMLTRQSGINYNLGSLYLTLSEKKGKEIRKELYRQLHILYKNSENLSLNALEKRKIQICYDLYNGNGFSHSKAVFKQMVDTTDLDAFGLPKNIKFRHFPIVGPIAAQRVGERASRPTKFSVVDTSGYTANLVKMKINEKLAAWLSKETIQPLVSQLYMQEMSKLGIEDPFSVNPDDRQQLLSQANAQVKTMLPEEIFDKFSRKYVSPLEERGSKFANFLLRQYKMHDMFREGHKAMVIGGGSVYKHGMEFGKPYIKQANLLKLKAYMDNDVDSFQYANAIVYQDSMSPVNFFIKYYPFLNNEQKAAADRFNVSPNPHGQIGDIQGQFLGAVLKGQVPMGQIQYDTNTEVGLQQYLNALGKYAGVSTNINQGGGIPYTHSQIRGIRQVKEVYRWERDGSVGIYYMDEAYQLDYTKGDIEFEWIAIEEIYETTEFMANVFTEQRLVPYQYTNILSPHTRVRNQYTGGYLSHLQGITANSSPMMKVVGLQYSYDLHYSLLDKDIANNMGKVLQVLTNMLGKKTPEEFSRSLKSAKIIALDGEKLGNIDVTQLGNMIRVLDLNNVSDTLARREHMREIKMDVALGMNYNMDRLGQPSPYKANASIENAIAMSNAQTLDEELVQDRIEQDVLQNFYDFAIQVYAKNPLETRFLSDDSEKALIDLNKDNIKELAAASLNILVMNSAEDVQLLDQAKLDLLEQNKMQPGYLEPNEVVEIRMTKSIARILNIANRAKDRRAQEVEQERAIQQQLQQALIDSKKEDTLAKMAHEKDMLKDRLATEEYKADKQSESLAHGFDTDQDGQSNQEETARVTTKSKERIALQENAIKMAALEVEKLKVKAANRNKK